MKTAKHPGYTQFDTLILGYNFLQYSYNNTKARLTNLEDKRALYGVLFDMESERFEN
jgi:hypothetical protein